MRTLWAMSAALLVGTVVLIASDGARADTVNDPRTPTLMVLQPQAGDTTLRYVLAWQPPAVGGAVGRIDVYDTRLIDARTLDTLAIGAATAAPDTLEGPFVVNDSVHVFAIVRAINQFGDVGPWSNPSNTLDAFIPSVPPGPPTDVTVDTLQRYTSLYQLNLTPKQPVVGKGYNLIMEAVAIDEYGQPVACEAATFLAVDSTATITDGGVCTRTQVVVYDSLSWGDGLIAAGDWPALVVWTVEAKAAANEWLVSALAVNPLIVGFSDPVSAEIVRMD
jgi:hypothetical protein